MVALGLLEKKFAQADAARKQDVSAVSSAREAVTRTDVRLQSVQKSFWQEVARVSDVLRRGDCRVDPALLFAPLGKLRRELSSTVDMRRQLTRALQGAEQRAARSISIADGLERACANLERRARARVEARAQDELSDMCARQSSAGRALPQHFEPTRLGACDVRERVALLGKPFGSDREKGTDIDMCPTALAAPAHSNILNAPATGREALRTVEGPSPAASIESVAHVSCDGGHTLELSCRLATGAPVSLHISGRAGQPLSVIVTAASSTLSAAILRERLSLAHRLREAGLDVAEIKIGAGSGSSAQGGHAKPRKRSEDTHERIGS